MPHLSASYHWGKPGSQATSINAALQALQAENATLKTRLAEAIRLCMDCGQLDVLEAFQGRFLALDAAIALLRREVAVKDVLNDNKLGRDLQRMGEELGLLKGEFEGYLTTAPEAGN